MPDMNGMDATRRIRELEKGLPTHTRIVGLTAHAQPAIQQECLRAGMDMVLTKPVQMHELFAAIDERS